MGSFSDTPALIAGGTIRPYRFVVASTSADNTGEEAANATTAIVGVADGSTRRFDSANHAESGDPINLQGGDVVLVQCHTATVPTRGALVQAHTDGTARVADTGAGPARRFQGYVALEDGASGRIIRIQKVAGFNYYA
jgi:hypothetical protein